MATTHSAAGHHRTSTKGRICCGQAIGENHDNELPCRSWMSPAARIMKARPNAARLMPTAPRPCPVTCAATKALAPNTMAPSPLPAVSANAPPRARSSPPTPESARADTIAITAFTTNRVTAAATAGACRPTVRASTSSERPLSSSPRVCRTMCRMLMIASPMTIQVMPSLAMATPTV